MMRCICIILLVLNGFVALAQKPKADVVKDSTTNRSVAEKHIIGLRNGTLVVRLKTNDKSINAYRNAGQTKLADKIEREQIERNLHLMRAFLLSFNFSDVRFVKASDTKRMLAGDKVFVNGALLVDTSITIPNSYILFAEYGDLKSNERVNEYKYDVKHTQASSTPTTSSALVISDTSLQQLQEPFPFYTLAYTSGNVAGGETESEPREATLPDNKRNKSAEGYGKIPFEKAVYRLSKILANYYYRVLARSGSKDESLAKNEEQEQRYRTKALEQIKDRLQKLNEGKETFYLNR